MKRWLPDSKGNLMQEIIELLGMAALVLAGVALVLALFMVVVWQLRFLVRAARKIQQL
jgi:hypothetical protein